VDRVFALHEENKRQIMEAYGINDERINIVGAGFRADVFRPPDVCVPAVDQKALTVVYAGKISAPKGVPWLIEAMRKVTPPPGKQVRLVLAGSAGDDSARRIQAQATDLPNVIFLGALDQSALGDVLRDADVFVLPSFFEGLPLVVMESLACDCRVVMTDLPGSDRWLPKTLCANRVVERVPLPRLVGPDTPAPEDLPKFVDDLAAALTRQLAAVVADPTRLNIACHLADFSWESVFARVQKTYREIAGVTA